LTLQERGHIAPVRRAAELRYRFQHALAQEAVYNGILRQTRRELHAVVAHTIETIYKDRLEEFYGMLSFHYALAEQWDEARSYMLLAGNRASEMAADAEAVALYRQAIVAYERALGARWAVAERADVYRKMGEAYFRLGNHEEALAYLQRALADLGRPFPNGRPAELLALSANLAKQAWYRVRGALARRRSRTDVEPQVALVARLYESLSWITGVNPEQVLLYVLSSANYSERHAYVPGLILSYAWLQTILDFAGLAGLGGYYGQKSLQLTDESRFPAQTGTSYAMRAVHENIRGRWASSLEYAQRANDLFHATDHWNVRAWTFSKLSLADGNIHLGQFATALEHATELELFGEESSDRQAWCWGLARQGFAYRGLGQTAVAGDALRKAMDVAKSIPDYQTYVDSGGELGHCLIRQGDLEEALHVFSECAEKSSEHNLKKSPVITRFLNGRADALLKLAEAETGPEREKKLKEAVDACHKALAQGKVYVPGMPEAQMLAGTLAWLQGNRSAAEDQWQKSIDNAAGLEVQFDLGRALLEAGSRLENVAFLRRAEDIFEHIEAQWELGIAQNKLAALQRG